jgi:FtsP/CotA-like multicopper oxidase with cupredoxin domain
VVQAPAAPKPAAQASGHAAAHTSHASVASTETKGNQLLEPRLEGDVKVFDVEAKVVKWEVVPGEFVEAWTYNGQVPGPLIRVTEGEKIRMNLKNSLPEATVIHFHGPMLPNSQDGVPDVTQPVVEPGQSFSYEFTAQPAGTFVYHTHHNSAVQEPKGLYGLFIVDPKEQRGPKPDREYFQVISELNGFFTINGKAFPATEPMLANVGERVLIRLVNLGQMPHPMHSHGHPFAIVATDGNPVQGPPLIKDTVNIAPGERYDLEITAKMPGTWVFHCHILSHVANKGVEPGGMISVFKIE